ncbi:acetoin utilization protein AcuC [Staphylococcus sp. HMSC068D08]|uniref:acetoin utilization protein AcuC n=1 Tax=Staphylococcus TaxID=1279 RepID=UPI0008A36635|nr:MULTISPECIES: acetoin utilization protein AcuC [Staphylococcus]MCC2085159.1 acetoin utilization protein AcuC [Staphylococcus lugdunensis]MCH8680958.1 acetoin utilization protein AcuC [Staphylococcus lugdunensis]MCI2827253.1 acetoin utilization protein AcuC [Staphylococcus lugdunensis]MCI2836704.1 acetoin utilization protein AcuC [Staphylococcus lugdunensis]MCM3467155.1 acetoin utilization protein AcuC [Staphylococcus lugdunensis]
MMHDKRKTGYVYSDKLLKYRFDNHHPFNQMRLKLTTELLQTAGYLNNSNIVEPPIATTNELTLVHQYDYVQAIKHASHGILSNKEADKYGLSGEDTNQFNNMHSHSARIVGGALTLADLIMKGIYHNGCHLGGGLHHALEGRANGFCVYNDVAITAKYLNQKYGQRVLIVDTDAHHGDGTQWRFYTDEEIMCYSIHETGKFLFPGSGHYTERGEDQGYGYTVNLPLEPYTEDASYLECLELSLNAIIEAFKPDIILSVHGVDIHFQDPLTHMNCTLDALYQIPYLINALAETYTDGKIIMFGGGGYNIWTVVPRAWSHVYLALTRQTKPHGALPQTWINKWTSYAPKPLPQTWNESLEHYINIPRREEISKHNLERALRIKSWYQ